MREELPFYGVIDGLAPQGRCSLHSHNEEAAAEHRLNAFTVHWSPFAEEKFPVRAKSKKDQPSIALLGGYCPEHPYLKNMRRYVFTDSELQEGPQANLQDLQKYCCIATHCAGIIGAKKTEAFEGLAPNCHLLNLQVISNNGKTSSSIIIEAIKFSIKQNVQVICIPIVLPFKEDSKTDQELRNMLIKAAHSGILIIAAKGSNRHSFPADEPYVLSVGAYNRKFEFSYQEIHKNNIADVAAPGEYIWSLHPAPKEEDKLLDIGLFCRMSGSAMATCLVAGLAARIATKSTIEFGYQFSELLQAGMVFCTVHPFPYKFSHLVDSNRVLIKKKENPPYFLSREKQSNFSFDEEMKLILKESASPNQQEKEYHPKDSAHNPQESPSNDQNKRKSRYSMGEISGIDNEEAISLTKSQEIPITHPEVANNNQKSAENQHPLPVPLDIKSESNSKPAQITNKYEINLTEEERQYAEEQKQLYANILESIEKNSFDNLLLIRMKQHSSLRPLSTIIQPFQFPEKTKHDLNSNQHAEDANKPEGGHQERQVFVKTVHYCVLDWVFNYFSPVARRPFGTGNQNGKMKEDKYVVNKMPYHVQLSLEAIYILISKRITDSQLEDILWRTLDQCKGHSYDSWVFVPTHLPEDNFSSFRTRIGYQHSKSELKGIYLYGRSSLFIPNVWEFCRILTEYDAIADAEPLFLETEIYPPDKNNSIILKAADPNYEMVHYVGIEPTYDLGDLADDISIAHLDTGYRKHECMYRSNILYEQGWDYVRHQSWNSLSDCWLFGNKRENASLSGTHGLATVSIITGVRPVTSGIAPNAKIIPIRSYYEKKLPYQETSSPLSASVSPKPAPKANNQENNQLTGSNQNKGPLMIGIVAKSSIRLINSILHARKVGADIITINLGLVSVGFAGILRRLIQIADRENIIICAAVGEYTKYSDGASVFLYPPGGGINSPARYPETIGTAGSCADDTPSSTSCCGLQADITSLVESVIVAADSSDEVIPESGARGVSGVSLSSVTIASLAALWLSYHRKEKLIKIYSGIAPLSTVFKYILYYSATFPKSWSNQTTKLFGNGTTKNIIGKILKLELPTPTQLREFLGKRKRCLPPIFGLDFLSDSISIHLQREIIFLYNTQPHFRKLPLQQLYREILGSLSDSCQKELVSVIEKSSYMTFEPRLGICMTSDGYLVSTNGQVYDIAKEINLTKKVNGDLAHFTPPSSAWRSIFYVGKDYEIHQYYWYQSLKHWVMGLYSKNLTQEFTDAKAKRTLGPVAFRENNCYYVYYVGLDNMFHLLRSVEQTHIWHHETVPIMYNDVPIFVHPDAGTMRREPATEPQPGALTTQGTCVSFRALVKHGSWQVHHLVAYPDAKISCPAGIPHHRPVLSALP